MEYGVAVNNKYDLFLEECDDPLEILRRKEEEAAKSKVEKNNAKNAPAKKSGGKAAPAATTKPAAGKTGGKPAQSSSVLTESKSNKIANQDSTGLRKDNAERPSRFGGTRQNENVNRPPRQQQQGGGQGGFGGGERENIPRSEFRGDVGDRENAGRGRGGYRRGRGGPGGRGRGGDIGGFDRFGKREFDRHSGSGQGGVKATEKREGGGAHNWGTIKDDIEDQLKVGDAAPEQTAEGETATTGGEQGTAAEGQQQQELDEAAAAAAAELEEEAKQMTLDEWKRLEEQRKVKAQFNVRQAGEGYKVDPKWKKMYQLKKKQEEEEEEEEEENDEEEHGKQKQTVNIPIMFNNTGRRGGAGLPRGGRGGRGGRGAGPRGPPRSGGGERTASKSDVAPNVADEADFPSLS